MGEVKAWLGAVAFNLQRMPMSPVAVPLPTLNLQLAACRRVARLE